MITNNNNNYHVIKDIIETPIKNLELKISHYKDEINKRQKINDTALSTIFTNISNLRNQNRRFDFNYQIGVSSQRQEILRQLFSQEITALNEIVSNFKDISFLKEKLINTQEEFELQNQRLKILT